MIRAVESQPPPYTPEEDSLLYFSADVGKACGVISKLGVVSGRRICGAKTTAEGRGVTFAHSCVPSSFTVTSRNTLGVPCHEGGGVIEVDLLSSDLQAKLNAIVSVTDKRDGTYAVTYTLPRILQAQKVALSVRANGDPISGSPFGVRVIGSVAPSFVSTWGSKGTAAGQLNVPVGVAVTPCGDVYVCDQTNHRVQVYTQGGVCVRVWGKQGAGNGSFQFPRAIAVTPQKEEVFVCDSGNNRVQVFDKNGKFLRAWGGAGSAAGQFQNPSGLSLSPSTSLLFISEEKNHRLQVYTRDGVYVRSWGSKGTGNGQFAEPRGLACHDGEVYVCDCGNHRVEVFTEDGKFLRSWGHHGDRAGEFNFPSFISVSPHGDVYVSEFGNSRIQAFSREGIHKYMWGGQGIGSGQFRGPHGVCVTAVGGVVVCDSANHRIQLFE